VKFLSFYLTESVIAAYTKRASDPCHEL